ncbi:MAG: putative sulfate exporter family transporter [Chloroflexota bacterium]
MEPALARPEGRLAPIAWTAAGLVVVLALAALTRFLELNVPAWLKETEFAGVARAIEFPVYAILLGLAANALLHGLHLRERMRAAFRTEFFIKTGLVLLGASINLNVIVSAALPALLQAVLLISTIFLFSWWLGGLFGLDVRLRALLSAAVSICGVSAAIAAAGAVHAKKEQLTYAASLVILFAVPMIFIQPWLASALGLPEVVAGAWIGGNIDTTAAVTAAGTIVGEDALKVAVIVKTTQNALMGFVAVLLTLYFVMRVETSAGMPRPGFGEIWRRFPKFVLGFIAASIIATWWVGTVPADQGKATIAIANALRTWFLILAFISIGLELRVASVREAGWRPLAVFATATAANLVVALALASILFANFTID